VMQGWEPKPLRFWPDGRMVDKEKEDPDDFDQLVRDADSLPASSTCGRDGAV
jgi:hypothetical protein